MIASLSFDVVVVSSLLPWRLRNCCRCQLMKHRSFSIFGREELLEFPRVQFFDWSQLGMLCGSVDRKGIGAEKGPLHERRFEISCNWNWGRPPSQDFEAVLQSQSRGWGAKISNNVCSKIADLCRRRRRHHRWTCLSTFFLSLSTFPFSHSWAVRFFLFFSAAKSDEKINFLFKKSKRKMNSSFTKFVFLSLSLF